MNTRPSVFRLLPEILAAIAVAASAVMFVMPLVTPAAHVRFESPLHATVLSLLAGPVIVWRVDAVGNRRGEAVDPKWR